MRKLLATIAAGLACSGAVAAPIPLLTPHGLEVDGKPFLILGGELANSSASSRAYMADRWAKLTAMHLNTVIMPISWELIEPAEGKFDFTLVDGLIVDARAHNLRLVVLWFGSWKNSMSSYVPAWVKRDSARFPRARIADGKPIEMLSPLVAANWQADARAFAALMTHLRDTDSQRTVLTVQVENEIGMIPEPRDQSPAALAAWAKPVPAGIPGSGKSWTEAYGADADEAFMAWAYAAYTDKVASAGKRIYPLPMYVNAALPRPTAKPGVSYPAAGPLPKYAAIWHAAAPSLDFLAPDIYFPSFVEWTKAYAALGKPFLIPEANNAGRADTTAAALFAIGQARVFGYSPFAIDAASPAIAQSIGELYTMLGGLTPLIAERLGTDRLAGLTPPVAFDGTVDSADQVVTMGGQRLTAHFFDPWTPKEKQTPETHGAIVIGLGEGEYLIAGRGVTVTFTPVDGKGISGIEAIDEGVFTDGQWVPGRRLNGDEDHQGRHLRLPIDHYAIQRVKLYRY